MSFVERVVGHVRRVQRIAQGTTRDKRVVIDYGRHVSKWRDALEEAEHQGHAPSPGLERWRGHRLRRLLEELHWQLLFLLGHELDANARAEQVDALLAIVVGLVEGRLENVNTVRDRIMEDIVRGCWTSVTDVEADPLGKHSDWYSVPGYCREVGVVAEQGACWRTTRAGEILLGLRGREAIRWLLTLETCLAESREDPWRVDRESLQAVLDARSYRLDGDAPMPTAWTHAVRLGAYGLVDFVPSPSGMGLVGWDVNGLGDAVLRAVIRGGASDIGEALKALHQRAVVSAV